MARSPTVQKALVWILREGASGPDALLLKRTARRGGTEHPVTGKAEPGETPPAAALREAKEETGLSGRLVDLHFEHRYQLADGTPVVERAFAIWVAEGRSAPRLSREHTAARWVPVAEALEVLEWGAHREALERAVGGGNGTR